MKYWQLNKTFLQRHMTYPARITIWTIVDVTNFIIFPFIWLAVYGDRQILAGFSRADIVTYYVIVALISLGFTSHISQYFRIDIIEGYLNTILVKPINFLVYRFIHEFSYRLVAISISAVVLMVMLVLFPDYVILAKSVFVWLLFFLALCLSFLISHSIEFIIGLGIFWLGEVNALQNIRHIFSKVFSGALAPLVFFPDALQQVAAFLPFKYMVYFPVQVYLGQLSNKEMLTGFIFSISWILVLSCIILIMWKRGLKRYDGAGM